MPCHTSPSPIALVVGFTDALARACARRLGEAGFVVVRAPHGIAAETEASRLRPALIVMSRALFSMEKRIVDTVAAAIGASVVETADESGLDVALRHAS